MGMRFFRKRSGVVLPKLDPLPAGTLKNFFYPLFWGTSDPRVVLGSIEQASRLVDGGFHFADNFFTWMRNNSMLEDGPFMRAWETNAESESDKAIVWRRYVLSCAAYHCVQLRGQFVECGAYTGVGVKTVVDYLGGVSFPKEFWIYDLFEYEEGMPHGRCRSTARTFTRASGGSSSLTRRYASARVPFRKCSTGRHPTRSLTCTSI